MCSLFIMCSAIAYIANRSLCQILDTRTNNSNLPVKLKVYLKEEIP